MGVPPNILLHWIHSFLMDRQQRVKIGETFSDWASPNGVMQQGIYFGPYACLSLIDDLKSLLEQHKFVDDCTLTEIIKEQTTSRMQPEIDSVNS